MASLNPTVLVFGKTFTPPGRWGTIQRISKEKMKLLYWKNYEYNFGANEYFLHIDFLKFLRTLFIRK